MSNTAGCAAFATALGFTAAIRAGFRSPLREVFSMFLAVARLAKSFSVADIETKQRMGCPRFYVVSMEFLASVAAALAGEVVALVDGEPPARNLSRKLFSLGLSNAAFPARMLGAFGGSSCAGARAINLFSLIGGKAAVAYGAVARVWQGTSCPACFGAEPRGADAICFNFKGLVAHKADKNDPVSSHNFIVRNKSIEVKYVAVCLERLADMGLKPVRE